MKIASNYASRLAGFWRLPFGWELFIHDDGWMLVDRQAVIVAEGKAPNSGYHRSWWRARR